MDEPRRLTSVELDALSVLAERGARTCGLAVDRLRYLEGEVHRLRPVYDVVGQVAEARLLADIADMSLLTADEADWCLRLADAYSRAEEKS